MQRLSFWNSLRDTLREAEWQMKSFFFQLLSQSPHTSPPSCIPFPTVTFTHLFLFFTKNNEHFAVKLYVELDCTMQINIDTDLLFSVQSHAKTYLLQKQTSANIFKDNSVKHSS